MGNPKRTREEIQQAIKKGKGSVDHWVCPVKPGRILFEIEGGSPEVAREAFKLAQYKLPIKTTIISREDQ